MFGKECADMNEEASIPSDEQKAPGLRDKLLQKLIEMLTELPDDQEKKPEGQGVEVVSMDVDPKKHVLG